MSILDTNSKTYSSITSRQTLMSYTPPTRIPMAHILVLRSVCRYRATLKPSYGLTLLPGKFGPFLYDKTKVSAADLPKNYLDLLDPKWKGKIIATIPNDDDAVGYLFSLIVGKYGWEWLEQFNKQDVQWVRGTATPAYILAEQSEPSKAGSKRPKEYVSDNGQRCITFTTAGYPLSSDILAWKTPDRPERYMSWTQTAAM
jgi:hypothetical protein